MERLYGSHNRARPSRIVCQPSDVILWINTPFDTKNFKRKYESLIKLHHFWRWYFLFFGEAVKKKLTDFGQLFWLTGKKLAEIRCRPFSCEKWKMKKNRRWETTLLFREKGEFFLNARENFRTLCAFCLLFREREREKKRNEEDALHPSEKRSKVSSFSLVFFLLTPSSIYF